MNSDEFSSGLSDRGLYMSCVDHYATGEGRMVCLAIACGREQTEDLLKSHVDPYFQSGRVTTAIETGMDESLAGMLAYVPGQARIVLRTAPAGCANYFVKLYFNLA